MKICEHCNRDTGCLHENPISIKETYFLIGFIAFFSQLGFVLFFHEITARNVVGISLIGYGSIVIILTFMTLMYFLVNKQYLALFFGCHQKKERSFHISKTPFILCSRCTGIFIGLYFSVFFFLIHINHWYLFVLMIPLIIDGVIQGKTKYKSNNVTRFITGLLFAPGFVILFGYINYFIHLVAVTILTSIFSLFL